MIRMKLNMNKFHLWPHRGPSEGSGARRLCSLGLVSPALHMGSLPVPGLCMLHSSVHSSLSWHCTFQLGPWDAV